MQPKSIQTLLDPFKIHPNTSRFHPKSIKSIQKPTKIHPECIQIIQIIQNPSKIYQTSIKHQSTLFPKPSAIHPNKRPKSIKIYPKPSKNHPKSTNMHHSIQSPSDPSISIILIYFRLYASVRRNSASVRRICY